MFLASFFIIIFNNNLKKINFYKVILFFSKFFKIYIIDINIKTNIKLMIIL